MTQDELHIFLEKLTGCKFLDPLGEIDSILIGKYYILNNELLNVLYTIDIIEIGYRVDNNKLIIERSITSPYDFLVLENKNLLTKEYSLIRSVDQLTLIREFKLKELE